MRIASLLPSATEILYALGAGDELVAVSEKCDFPEAARRLPVVVRARLDDTRSQQEIDDQVNRLLQAGESLYDVDAAELARLQCDLLITQDVCHVCAASPADLERGWGGLRCPPRVLSLNPRRLDDVWRDVERIGEATGRDEQARRLAAALSARTRPERGGGATAPPPRLLCLEWFAPPYIAGHWVPDMVERAGGRDVLGVAGEPGFACGWERVLACDPEIIVLMPCGFDLDQVERQSRAFAWPRGWSGLAAVRTGHVYAVDASGQFSRHGPRLADGVDTLRAIIGGFHGGAGGGARGPGWRRLSP